MNHGKPNMKREDFMQKLVFMNRGDKQPYTTSKIVAKYAQVQHETIVRLLSNYKEDVEEFGVIRFEIGKPPKGSSGGRPEIIYRLNEEQATLLIAYLQNTVAVRVLKKELVRQFYEMRALLLELNSSIWKDTRAFGKHIRKQETDSIKRFVDYATAQGSQHADRYYTSLSILADETVGITDRNRATTAQLNNLQLVENLIAKEIHEGIENHQPYKQIYQACRKRLENYAAVAGLYQEKAGV